MSPDLEKKLYDKYPKIFKGVSKPITESLMGFGLEHGDGWYDIVDVLCRQIQQHIDHKTKRYNILSENNPNNIPIGSVPAPVEAVQIKEKFGELRFYYDGGDDFISGLVTLAESMSSKICEVCGNKGHTRGGSWIRTLCDDHAKNDSEN